MEIWTLCILIGTGSILLHASSLVLLATVARRVRIRLELHSRNVRDGVGAFIALLTFICVALGLLHVVEAAVWAAIYVGIGASGINLTDHWRLLGAIEASVGVFLFGMSTAFLFSVMQADFSILMNDRNRD